MPVVRTVPAGGMVEPEPGAAPLSPWPTTGDAKARAVARLRAAVAGRAAESDDEACALGEMAAARVEKEAPGAPQSVKDEAVLRASGYAAQMDFGTIRREEMGPRAVEYVTNHSNAWRHSGAAALLSPWRVRRAGAIG